MTSEVPHPPQCSIGDDTGPLPPDRLGGMPDVPGPTTTTSAAAAACAKKKACTKFNLAKKKYSKKKTVDAKAAELTNTLDVEEYA